MPGLNDDQKKRVQTIIDTITRKCVEQKVAASPVVLTSVIRDHLDVHTRSKNPALLARRDENIATLHALVTAENFTLAKLPDTIKAAMDLEELGDEVGTLQKGTGGGQRRIRDTRGL